VQDSRYIKGWRGHPVGSSGRLYSYRLILTADAKKKVFFQFLNKLQVLEKSVWELTYHKSNNRHVSVAMQRLVDFVSIVTQQYVTTQQSFNDLLAGFSVGRSIHDSPLLCNG
jgi:hypothetical protein